MGGKGGAEAGEGKEVSPPQSELRTQCSEKRPIFLVNAETCMVLLFCSILEAKPRHMSDLFFEINVSRR